MKKNKMFIGLSIAVVVYKFYDSNKSKIKPKIVKSLANAISIGENTKKIFIETKETALKLNKESYDLNKEEFMQESEPNIIENINNLKKRMTEIQEQLSIL